MLVGNVSNAIVHSILEKAIVDSEVKSRYKKEMENSLEIAKRYRLKINPANTTLPEVRAEEIKEKLPRIVKTKLNERISKGYKNINLDRIEEEADAKLKELKVR